jgi:hypothetical protein
MKSFASREAVESINNSGSYVGTVVASKMPETLPMSEDGGSHKGSLEWVKGWL